MNRRRWDENEIARIHNKHPDHILPSIIRWTHSDTPDLILYLTGSYFSTALLRNAVLIPAKIR